MRMHDATSPSAYCLSCLHSMVRLQRQNQIRNCHICHSVWGPAGFQAGKTESRQAAPGGIAWCHISLKS